MAKKELVIQYYGTRGSIASPGKDTIEFGGNTTCIAVRLEEDGQVIRHLAIDCGTGIRLLGNDLMKEPAFQSGKGHIDILQSHTHWDHIQGFPFFVPAYIPGNSIHFHGHASGDGPLADVFKTQQMSETFPVNLDNMQAAIIFEDVEASKPFQLGEIEVDTILHAHPGSSLGFRISCGSTSLVICTDVEHTGNMSDKLSKFAQNCALFAYDSQYLVDEYPDRKGWGHSIKEEAISIARESGAGELHLIHHDPARSDAQLRELEKEAQKDFKDTLVAREGMVRRFEVKG